MVGLVPFKCGNDVPGDDASDAAPLGMFAVAPLTLPLHA